MKDYKRLTRRGVNGRAYYATPFTSNSMQEIYEEDVKRMQEVMERLCDLEDKIDNGTLVELPCKVGDVLYYVNKYETTPRIEENKVHTIEIYECRDGLTIRIWTQNGTFYADKMPNVFLTKAEAEAKLRELKGE